MPMEVGYIWHKSCICHYPDLANQQICLVHLLYEWIVCLLGKFSPFLSLLHLFPPWNSPYGFKFLPWDQLRYPFHPNHWARWLRFKCQWRGCVLNLEIMLSRIFSYGINHLSVSMKPSITLMSKFYFGFILIIFFGLNFLIFTQNHADYIMLWKRILMHVWLRFLEIKNLLINELLSLDL